MGVWLPARLCLGMNACAPARGYASLLTELKIWVSMSTGNAPSSPVDIKQWKR